MCYLLGLCICFCVIWETERNSSGFGAKASILQTKLLYVPGRQICSAVLRQKISEEYFFPFQLITIFVHLCIVHRDLCLKHYALWSLESQIITGNQQNDKMFHFYLSFTYHNKSGNLSTLFTQSQEQALPQSSLYLCN